MASRDTIGFLCYNNSELVRDGYIDSVVALEHNADDFNFRKLTRNRKGVTYQLIKDDPDDPDKITKVIERRKLLPAEKIKIEIQFGKTLKNAVTHPIAPGAIPGFVGFLVGNPLAGIGFGGVTSGYTDFVYDIIDSEMKINEKIKITQEVLNTGIITFDSFPVSIFGIVREYQEELLDDAAVAQFKETHPQGRVELDPVTGATVGKVGLDFTGEQTERIGQHSRGSYQGGPRKRIDGATNKEGQFGEVGVPRIQIVENLGDSGEPPDQEVVLLAGQENIFVEIVRDYRKLKFRGDNRDVSGQRRYPFKNRGLDDVTDNSIRIDLAHLRLDDTIYITFCTSSKRRVRQAMRHKGIVGQGNTVGVTGWNLEIGSEMDIFDFQIRDWIVPAVVPRRIDSPDDQFKITFNEYRSWKIVEDTLPEDEAKSYFNQRFDRIEGWRMSSVITSRLDVMWAADYRGIVLMGDNSPAVVVFPVSSIKDREWFLNYVKGLDFVEKHEDPITGNIIYDNLEIKIDHIYKKLNKMAEGPIDIGSTANALNFDREKIPYYYDFAKALQSVSSFDEDIIGAGVGIPALDVLLKQLLDDGAIPGLTAESFYKEENAFYISQIGIAFNNATWSTLDLKYSDLSLSHFQWSPMQPIATWDCSVDFPIKEHHYNCHTYDPGGGPGIWFSTSYIENELFEWRPPGGFIESYWKMDTPYFCGEFGKKTRIYIERVGGNSLDNNSWIYVDTRADVPETISMDKNILTEEACLFFYDNDYQDSASYHLFSDNTVKDSFKFLEINLDKTHARDFLNSNDDESAMIEVHNNQKIIGYNNILGDSPSYSKGQPLTNDFSYVFHNNLIGFWQEVDILNGTNPSGLSFDLDFSENIPRINNIPSNWAMKEINIEYRIPSGENIKVGESYITLYFEEEEVSINNLVISKTTFEDTYLLKINCQYYNSETIQLLGDIWKKIDVIKFNAIIADTFELNDVKIKEGQTSVVYDGNGKTMVFFADSKNGNISVAVSYNNGKLWNIFRDIVRLVSDEVITLPVALQDSKTKMIHLFYVLNDSFLMYKPIDPEMFVAQDIWVDYVAPDFYDNTSTDDDVSDESSSLYPFSDPGRSLRRGVSYFVLGDAEDQYFIDQITITNNILLNNSSNNLDQSIRFNFLGETSSMDSKFNGKPFAVNIDNRGVPRLFFTEEDGGFSIKFSRDYFRWDYIAKSLPLHKTYLTDDIIEEDNTVISNIQVARNYYDEGYIYIFYFYRGMLLMRVLSPEILTVDIDGSGDVDETRLRKYLDITSNSYSSLPIFIVGNIPDDILNLRVRELDDGSVSQIAIQFPYNRSDILKKFNQDFEIDTSTQVFSYITGSGAVRVFYKDILGNVNGAYITGELPVLEIFYELKKE
jgi:hypothetical protein